MFDRIRVVMVVLGLAAGCANDPIVAPAPGSECTYQEVACSGGGCCPSRAYDCGGIWPNCPKNECCPNDGDDGRAYGARSPVKKRYGKPDGGT